MLRRELRMFASQAAEAEEPFDALQDAILAFTKSLPAAKQASKDMSALAANTADFAAEAPQAIVDGFNKLQAATLELLRCCDLTKVFIASRMPTMKAEDNIGVSIQTEVLKIVDATASTLEGKGEKGPLFAGLGAKLAYLKDRCAIEKELMPSPPKKDADGKEADKEKPAPPSTRAQGIELDRSAAGTLSRSFAQIEMFGMTLGMLIARNAEMLARPRRDSNMAM